MASFPSTISLSMPFTLFTGCMVIALPSSFETMSKSASSLKFRTTLVISGFLLNCEILMESIGPLSTFILPTPSLKLILSLISSTASSISITSLEGFSNVNVENLISLVPEITTYGICVLPSTTATSTTLFVFLSSSSPLSVLVFINGSLLSSSYPTS